MDQFSRRPRLDLFDYLVVENGAVLYDPRTQKETILAVRPPDAFIHRLEQREVTPLQVGRVIVATWLPHHIAALQVIQELGLELHIVFNPGDCSSSQVCKNAVVSVTPTSI